MDAFLSARHNRPIAIRNSLFHDHTFTEDLDGQTWVQTDSAPSPSSMYAGLSHLEFTVPASLDELAVAAKTALRANASSLLQTRQQFVVASNLVRSTTMPAGTVWLLSTVFPSDPLAMVLAVTVQLSAFFDSITALSPHVVGVLYDPDGRVAVPTEAPCALAEAENVVEGSVSIATAGRAGSWRVVVGQCPQFTQVRLGLHAPLQRKTLLVTKACTLQPQCE